MIDNISLLAQSAIKIKNNKGKIIYFDPYKIVKNYNDADYIFITHSHYDHFSEEDLNKVKKNNTKIIVPEEIKEKCRYLGFNDDDILSVMPDKYYYIDEIKFNTVRAYNGNKDFHKKEYNWVGYIVEIDNKKVYVAGDTDNVEEIRNIKCDIACVPVGGTYTMTAEEAADLISEIKPSVAIPIHYKTIVGSVEDAEKFKELLNGKVEVLILMK